MRRLVLKEKGCTTKIEPRVLTEQGFKILDLCSWTSDNYIECDVGIILDVFNLDRKVSKYDIQDVHKWKLKKTPVSTQRLHPDLGAFMCNWRGVMAEKSFKKVLDGLRHHKIKPREHLLSALQHSYKIWRHIRKK